MMSILNSRTAEKKRKRQCMSLVEGENQGVDTWASLGICMGSAPEHLGMLIVSYMKWCGLGTSH